MPEGANWLTLVAQLPGLGVRFKVQVGVVGDVPGDEMDDEVLRRMFRSFAPLQIVAKHEEMLAALDRAPPPNDEPAADGLTLLRLEPVGA